MHLYRLLCWPHVGGADTSGSMSTRNRLKNMQVAVEWVLNTLGGHDYATVIRYVRVLTPWDPKPNLYVY